MAHDFKKAEKELYQPKTRPQVIEVPELLFLMIDGKGDPNTSEEYAGAVQALYSLSYTIRMNKTWPNYFEYVVPPLEGLWEVEDKDFRGGGAVIEDKNKLIWTAMIRQPDFVTPQIFEEAKRTAAAKRPEQDFSKVRLEHYAEGLCIQALHIGPYNTEPVTVLHLSQYAEENGFAEDFTGGRRHHEIYLSDPRKTEPEKLKTVLRHPIRRLK